VSEQAEDVEEVKAPVKSKKMLIIIGAAVLVLLLLAGGAFLYISKQRAAAAEEGDDGGHGSGHAVAKSPPAYLPLENMVVNLADPGGEKVAQIGITLVAQDAHAIDTVKAYLPTIRNGVLRQISKRTAGELLSLEGKDKLANDILRESSIPFGGDAVERESAPVTPVKKNAGSKADKPEYPVVGVLFSSFIVQ